MLADRLPRQTGLDIGERGVEDEPESLPGAGLEHDDSGQQLADRGEVADEGHCRPDGDDGPEAVLCRLDQQLAEAHRSGIEPQACQVVALDPRFYPGKDARINRLRASKAAEQAPGEGSDQEQRRRRNDQHQGQQERILRPENQAEQIELFVGDVEQHRLPDRAGALPIDPA
ncbi:hypothetical protein SDC9_141725 [bioreactor metagenome]|uniref:Uncharacterized protein n=1 Tax=bioreactor metagenome TaxID=1076179 RepID=A0A645DZ82_9ZZZZ